MAAIEVTSASMFYTFGENSVVLLLTVLLCKSPEIMMLGNFVKPPSKHVMDHHAAALETAVDFTILFFGNIFPADVTNLKPIYHFHNTDIYIRILVLLCSTYGDLTCTA